MPCNDVTFDGYKKKLVDRLYGLLCEREKNGEWEKYLESIQIELRGFSGDSINYWRLLGNIGCLKLLSFAAFRRTIFECIHIVQGIEKNELS